MEFRTGVELAPYTTFGVGGTARWFAEATSEDDVAAGVEFALQRGLRLFVLGGGSNLLVSDEGFPGLVLRIALRGITRIPGAGLFSAAAGEDWDAFVAQTVAANCSGIECLSGIPGTVGGAPVQNVGAYGQEVSQTIAGVRVFDREKLRWASLSNADCRFAYRRSIFNSTSRERYIVGRVEYALREDGAPTLAYEDLRNCFADRMPTLQETRSAVRAIRARKGMLAGAGDSDSQSAGSFFKNPVTPRAALARVATVLGIEEDQIPRYPAPDGEVKLSAAWLLEQAGFHKSYCLGRAGISSRHALALVNRGGAKASDLVALRDKIVEAVESRFGIRLEPEPVWVA